MMEHSSAEQDSQLSSGPLERRLTREEKQRLNSESLSSEALRQDSSTELAPALEWVKVELAELELEDFQTLDVARKTAWYVLSVEDFAADMLAGKYDIWRMSGIPDCHILILTNFEIMPREKFLNVHFLAGRGVAWNRKALLSALGRLMDEWDCTAVIYMAANEFYAKRLGGEKLTTLYRFTREALNGRTEERNPDHKE